MERIRLPVVLAFVALPSLSLAVFDDFDDDPTTNPEWEFYDPFGQSQTLTEDGVFRYTFPAGIVMDHWSTVDNAAQLRRSDFPDEDWIMETRLKFIGSGDPEAPEWPPVDEAYQAALMVAFGQFDMFYWGPYRSTNLWLERSGQNALCIRNRSIDAQEVSLQVKKVGTTYTFSYRETDDDDWIEVCSRTATQVPLWVGLVFKSWNPAITRQETFEFDYFRLESIPQVAPDLRFVCPIGTPDRAWIDMPYTRSVQVTGFPVPEVKIVQGPATLAYDETRRVLGGWTPEIPVEVPIQLELSNAVGTKTISWTVDVAAPSALKDDDFDDDPTLGGLFELYEPQLGIAYSIVDDGETWWRMEVPVTGEMGGNFDTWSGVDRAPQLRVPVEPDEDFVIDTRLRIPAEGRPAPNATFLAGLMVNMNGSNDLITWSIGGERLTPVSNVFAERSGVNNLCNCYVSGLMEGEPVELRIEKRCGVYDFYYRGSIDVTWKYCGSYQTADPPLYVGLVMKTWGTGVQWTVDFDYFDFVEPGPKAIFTVTPKEGPAPLEVALDGRASTSARGAIVSYEWDFGDGFSGTGATQTHVYDQRGNYVVRLTVKDSAGDMSTSSQVVRVKFGSQEMPPWKSDDIGAPVAEGGARREGQDCIRLLAGGVDLAGAADDGYFLHQPLTGNGSIVARLSSGTWRSSAKIGVMMRESLEPGSRHASMLLQTVSATSVRYVFARRTVAGQTTSASSGPSASPPNAWVKLERTGDEFVGSWSQDGSAWTELGRVTLALPETIEVGIAAAARDTSRDGSEIEAVLCNVEVKGGAGPGKTVFHRGDANADGSINITDGIFVLNYLFLGGATPPCLEAANPNDDEAVNITDGIYILNFLFLGGSDPAPPGPPPQPCGPDPEGSAVDLGCEAYESC